MPSSKPLAGLRVLDLSRLLPGPYCSLVLAQLGAEVIKIEEPQGGDYTRALSPQLFALLNRGKKSITLDLRQPEDRGRLLQLVAEADVLLESFRPGVMDRLGCGYETLRALNPRLVYAALTGYGQTGPYRDRAGHDMNYCAYAGVLDQIGNDGSAPALSNLPIADLAGGALTCAVGILAALQRARATGAGCCVDVGMLDGTLALQQVALATLRSDGRTQPRGSDLLSGGLPNYRLYRCRDGRYLAVGALEPKFFRRVLSALIPTAPPALKSALGGWRLGRRRPGAANEERGSSAPQFPERLQNPARARRLLAPLGWTLTALFLLRPRDEWVRLFTPHDACVSPVLTLEEALLDEQVRARGLVESLDGKPAIRCPIRFDGLQPDSGDAPALGEHNAEVLGLRAVH